MAQQSWPETADNIANFAAGITAIVAFAVAIIIIASVASAADQIPGASSSHAQSSGSN